LSTIPAIRPFPPFDLLLSATPFRFPPQLSNFPQRLSNFPRRLSIFQEIRENLSMARSGETVRMYPFLPFDHSAILSAIPPFRLPFRHSAIRHSAIPAIIFVAACGGVSDSAACMLAT
jgi:hypothetical protein